MYFLINKNYSQLLSFCDQAFSVTVSERIINLEFLYMTFVQNHEITKPENTGYVYMTEVLAMLFCIVAKWGEFVPISFSTWYSEECVLVNSCYCASWWCINCDYSVVILDSCVRNAYLCVKGSPGVSLGVSLSWIFCTEIYFCTYVHTYMCFEIIWKCSYNVCLYNVKPFLTLMKNMNLCNDRC